MKELKHMQYFESLLYEANNDLVRQAQQEGGIAVGYTCFHMPEVLLNIGDCFSVRLRAPQTGSMELSTYYMSNATCEYARALLERYLEGGYQFLDCMAGVDVCECMNRSMENMELLSIKESSKEGFFWSNLDSPCTDDEDAVEHVTEQVTRKVLNELHANYGVDITEDAIRLAVEEHNQVSRLITEIAEFKKDANPRITGYEFFVTTLITYVCPKRLVIDLLKETLEEVKTRVPDVKPKFRAKVVLIGSEIDDPELIKLIEDNGAYVAADRFCYGSLPGRSEIILNEQEPVVKQIVRKYLQDTLCVRHAIPHKNQKRLDYAKELVRDFNADGIIYEQIKFCTYWSYERALSSHIMQNENGIPTLSIDRPYMARSSGQLRTRVQAFVENIEIKKIKAKKKQGVI